MDNELPKIKIKPDKIAIIAINIHDFLISDFVCDVSLNVIIRYDATEIIINPTNNNTFALFCSCANPSWYKNDTPKHRTFPLT